MADPGYTMFASLDSVERIRHLISIGEAEGPHLECKSPAAPQLSRDLKVKLAEATSGFANTGGGVILWGVSTTKHAHSELDILSQIEPVGNCRKFAQEVDRAIPMIAYPTVTPPSSRILVEAKGDTKGVVVTYISPAPGDPVQSLMDRQFYFRNSDEFAVMPYEVLKRMFTGVAAPDLRPVFDHRLVTIRDDGIWRIPIILENQASTAADHTRVTVEVTTHEACESIEAEVLTDSSHVNPGKRIFEVDEGRPIYRGLNQVLGTLLVQMKKAQRAKRVLSFDIRVYSSHMRARKWTMKVQLAKKGFSVRKIHDEFLY